MKTEKGFEKIKRELLMLEPITSAITIDMNISEIFISLIAPITQVLEANVSLLVLKNRSKFEIVEYYADKKYPDLIGKEIKFTDEEMAIFSECFIINKIDLNVSNGIKPIYSFLIKTLGFNFKSIMVVPLKDYGYKIIIDKAPNRFSQYDITFCKIVSNILSAILLIQDQLKEIIKKNINEKELEIASQIQKNLMPSEYPPLNNLDLYGFSHPVANIGGDYYDFISLNENKLGVIVADVAGKGVPAALIMVMIRSILRTIANNKLCAADTINALNNIMVNEMSPERYTTVFYYLYDIKTNRICFSNAGHCPLIIYRKKSDDVELFNATTIPIGIEHSSNYEPQQTFINPGDVILTYSDGIIEAMNEDREEFSIERLIELLKNNANYTAKEIGKTIKTEIKSFVQESEQHDDQTMVIVKLKKP